MKHSDKKRRLFAADGGITALFRKARIRPRPCPGSVPLTCPVSGELRQQSVLRYNGLRDNAGQGIDEINDRRRQQEEREKVVANQGIQVVPQYGSSK